MVPRPLIRTLVLAAGVGLLAQAPPTRKWVGSVIAMPGGGTAQTTIYYGPWQCRQVWLTDCNRRCGVEGRHSMGCIWLADLKTDVKTRFVLMPISWGGKFAITHCCCDWPELRPVNRDAWERGRDRFRTDWEKEFGAWLSDGKVAWPGHHIHDLLHGGSQLGRDNILSGPGQDRTIPMLTDELVDVLRSHHPNSPATPAEIAEFERKHGIVFDAELRAFYTTCNGASLFRTFDSPYLFLSLNEIMTGRTAIFGDRPDGVAGQSDAPRCPPNVFAFCYVQDGNYVAFETGPQPYPMLDLFHETWPKYRDAIEPSFGEFLRHALRSEGRHYWLSRR